MRLFEQCRGSIKVLYFPSLEFLAPSPCFSYDIVWNKERESFLAYDDTFSRQNIKKTHEILRGIWVLVFVLLKNYWIQSSPGILESVFRKQLLLPLLVQCTVDLILKPYKGLAVTFGVLSRSSCASDMLRALPGSENAFARCFGSGRSKTRLSPEKSSQKEGEICMCQKATWPVIITHRVY